MKSTFPSIILRYLLLGTIFFLPGWTPTAQGQTSVEASLTNTIVFRGESFGLQVVINNNQMVDVELPILPDLNGVRLLSNVPSRSTSFQMINGRTSSNITYTYTLMASEEGDYTIPPISITVNGQTLTTNPIPFKIVSQKASDASNALPDIFLRIELDDETPVVGQQLVASITLYFRDGTEISSYQPLQGWRADGFWREELENSTQPRAESILLQNQRYRKAVLLRFALFPTRSGPLTLAPYGMMLGVRNRSANRDPFGSIFDSFGTNQRRITVESEPITITVASLSTPTTGLMSDAVGEFRVWRTLNQTQVTRGEGIEVITTFEGTGNLPLISRLRYKYPTSFEEYSPQENTELNRVGTEISGRKTFTELLVAQESGSFEMPAEQVAIYNPKLNRWQTITLPSLSLTVSEPVLPSFPQPSAQSGIPSLVDGTLGSYNRYTIPGYLFSGGRVLYLIYLPILILILAFAIKIRQLYLLKNSGLILRNSAARRALNDIKELQKKHEILAAVQEDSTVALKEVYRKLLHILTVYYTERTEQTGSAMVTSDILKDLTERSRQKGTAGSIQKIEFLLTKLGRISYSPEVSSADLKQDLNEAVHLITFVEDLLA